MTSYIFFLSSLNSSTDKMVKEFKRVAGPNIIHVTDVRNFNLLGMVVTDSVTHTIMSNLGKTMQSFKSTATGFESCRSHLSGSTLDDHEDKVLKHYSISELQPDYDEMQTVKKVWVNLLSYSNGSEKTHPILSFKL